MSDLYVIAIRGGLPFGNPMGYDNFRALYPGVSFPATPTAAIVSAYGYALYAFTTPPTPGRYEKVQAAPAQYDTSAQVWRQAWAVVPMTAPEQATVNAAALSQLRLERNNRLSACDWTQLPDVVLTAGQVADWRTYRQTLRDYIEQVTDPFNPPVWPTPPGS